MLPPKNWLRLIFLMAYKLSQGERQLPCPRASPLFLMNSDFMVDQTTALAKGLSELESDEEKIERIFLSALQRKLLASETIQGLSYIQSMTQMLTEEVTNPDRRRRCVASYAKLS